MNNDRHWLIWSCEHKAWWRTNFRGYSEFLPDAGRYTREEVLQVIGTAGPEKKLDVVPDPYGPMATTEFS